MEDTDAQNKAAKPEKNAVIRIEGDLGDSNADWLRSVSKRKQPTQNQNSEKEIPST